MKDVLLIVPCTWSGPDSNLSGVWMQLRLRHFGMDDNHGPRKKLLCLSDEVVFRNAQNLQCDWFQINIHQFCDGVTVNSRKDPGEEEFR